MQARTALFVTPGLQLGGAERHIVLLAQHLDRSRWRPRVLAYEGGPLQQELEDLGVPVDLLPPPSGVRGVLGTAAALRQHLGQHRPAVVTSQHFAADLPVRIALAQQGARARRRTPYVVWKHTYGHVGHRGARERAMERATGRLVTDYAGVCFTQVTYLRGQLGLPTEKITVMQNSLPATVVEGGRVAVDACLPETARGPAGRRGPVAVVVGVLRADKGHRDLLTAWADVQRRVPEASLLVVGDGPERSELEAAARSQGLDGVHFLGSRVDGPLLAAGADVFVLASYNIECFPYAVLEAMAGGIPVVSTVTGGIAEMVDDGVTGVLVPRARRVRSRPPLRTCWEPLTGRRSSVQLAGGAWPRPSRSTAGWPRSTTSTRTWRPRAGDVSEPAGAVGAPDHGPHPSAPPA
jgi:glycosyltransferase involved in cell wall biosynthesis